MEQGLHTSSLQALTPLQEVQLDQKTEPAQRRARAADELRRGISRSSGRKHVIHDQHAVVRAYRVVMHLQGVGPILQRVFDALSGGWKLSRLTNGDKPCSELERDRYSEQKTVRCDRKEARAAGFLLTGRIA